MKQFIESLTAYLQANGEVSIYLVENTKPVLTAADYPYAVLAFPAIGDANETLQVDDGDGLFEVRLTVADTTSLNTLLSVNKLASLLKALRVVPLEVSNRLVAVESIESLTPVQVDRSLKIQDTNGFPFFTVLEVRVRSTFKEKNV